MLDFCDTARYTKQVVRERQAIEYGGIAQLGERLNGIQEVSGSIPLISTNKALKTLCFQGFSHARNFLDFSGTIFDPYLTPI